jgi:hypothetical protein
MSKSRVLLKKYTVNFHNKDHNIIFATNFLITDGLLNTKLIISAAGSLRNPIGFRTIMEMDYVEASKSNVPRHFLKKPTLSLIKDIITEYSQLIQKIPRGLYEYKGIRIVLSPEEFHKVTEEDVIDMDSLDPLVMQTVKYATALVHAFIILQTDNKLPKWLNEELEEHRALNILEG